MTEWWLLQTSLHQCCVKNMSRYTVRRRLCEAGLYSRIAAKKQLLRKQNNVKKLLWTKAHKDRTIEHWNKVLWTDESKLEIFGSNRRVYVWQRVDERAAAPYITPSVKHRGGSVMVGGYWLQSWRYVPGEEQIKSDWLSQHTATSCDPI